MILRMIKGRWSLVAFVFIMMARSYCSGWIHCPSLITHRQRGTILRSSQTTARSQSRILLALSSNNEEKVELTIDASKIKQELGQLFPSLSKRTSHHDNDAASHNAPYWSVQELQAYVQARAEKNVTSKTNTANDSSSSTTAEANDENDLFSATLDAEAYLRASDGFGVDGFLQEPRASQETDSNYDQLTAMNNPLFRSFSVPPPAKNRSDATDKAMSEQELHRLNDAWKATQQELFSNVPASSASANAMIHSEELHQQVFAEEQGFLNQSQVFREALLEPTQSNEAWIHRHGHVLRARQEQAMAELDEQIQEIQSNLQKFAMRTSGADAKVRCSRCRSMLDKEEIRENEGVRRSKTCRACHADDLIRRSRGQGPLTPHVGGGGDRP
ncbi:hypothetical protein MPSEU_000658600 [Mayamaea pseudoterrestris]|nr:hypothetical protein MPSEU_000658600 [Mayamaea pseudoterrestris]